MSLWHGALVAVGVGVVLAILAAAVKRDWIALPNIAVLGWAPGARGSDGSRSR